MNVRILYGHVRQFSLLHQTGTLVSSKPPSNTLTFNTEKVYLLTEQTNGTTPSDLGKEAKYYFFPTGARVGFSLHNNTVKAIYLTHPTKEMTLHSLRDITSDGVYSINRELWQSWRSVMVPRVDPTDQTFHSDVNYLRRVLKEIELDRTTPDTSSLFLE